LTRYSNITLPATRRVVVVLGQPDDTLVASLRAVGLVPTEEDREVVTWGPAAARARGRCESRLVRRAADRFITIIDAAGPVAP
jgi:hypothetical protein